jgi:hypothetical protein
VKRTPTIAANLWQKQEDYLIDDFMIQATRKNKLVSYWLLTEVDAANHLTMPLVQLLRCKKGYDASLSRAPPGA